MRTELEGIKRTLITIQKRQAKKKPLLLNMPIDSDGGAIWYSPSKVQQARDLQHQKDQEQAEEQARKDNKKLQQQLTKESKELEKIQKAQIRQEKREQRLQEAAEKQHQKDEQELTKLVDLQLQKDVLATPKAPKRPKKQVPRPITPTAHSKTHLEDNGGVVTINRRGRAIRPPARFRD